MLFTRLVFCLLTSIPEVALSQAAPTSILKINFSTDFEVTGDTSSSAWKNTPWLILPHREGNKKYQTKTKLLYSKTGIYGIFYCEDEKIVSTLKKDFSDLWNEDVIEVFFWTDESIPLYFEYELSPHNVELPILVPNNNGTFLGWMPWHYEGERKTRHATYITGQSWTAEFFIPYTLLKPLNNVPPVKATQWRCNFYRIDYDEGPSEWSWKLTGKSFHDYKSFGSIVFD